MLFCPSDYSNNYEQILMKFFRGMGQGPRTND